MRDSLGTLGVVGMDLSNVSPWRTVDSINPAAPSLVSVSVLASLKGTAETKGGKGYSMNEPYQLCLSQALGTVLLGATPHPVSSH